MPTLDSCVNSVFEPGNIGSSAGTTPTVVVFGSLLDPEHYDPAAQTYSLQFQFFYNFFYYGMF